MELIKNVREIIRGVKKEALLDFQKHHYHHHWVLTILQFFFFYFFQHASINFNLLKELLFVRMMNNNNFYDFKRFEPFLFGKPLNRVILGKSK